MREAYIDKIENPRNKRQYIDYDYATFVVEISVKENPRL